MCALVTGVQTCALPIFPTRPLTAEGQITLPSVSVPTPTLARLAAIALPVPALEPHGLRSSTYGLRVWPPRALQPDAECVERKLAHSLRLVLPRITAPAARRRATKIGRAHVCTPVTNAHLVCRLLLEKKKTTHTDSA